MARTVRFAKTVFWTVLDQINQIPAHSARISATMDIRKRSEGIHVVMVDTVCGYTASCQTAGITQSSTEAVKLAGGSRLSPHLYVS